MPEQGTELRRINWPACFPFTLIFRSFKIAIQPTKLLLALGGILSMAVAGSILDGIWPGGSQPVQGEVAAYWQTSSIDDWRDSTLDAQASMVRDIAGRLVNEDDANDLVEDFEDDPNEVRDELLSLIADQFEERIADAKKANSKAEAGKPQLLKDMARIGREHNALYQQVARLGHKGVFEEFFAYQQAVVLQLVDAARHLNFTGGLQGVLERRSIGGVDRGASLFRQLGAEAGSSTDFMSDLVAKVQGASSAMVGTPAGEIKGMGVVSCIVLAVRGKQWLLTEHWFYMLLFSVASLAIWAFFGGAICRIAALNVARDERVSAKAATGFACRKIASFMISPVLPGLLIAVIGAVIAVLGLIMVIIPWLGDLVGGLIVLPALLGGFVMALVVVGAIGGGFLMWPTIAVEGSDGFDAMSRSYSYVFSKPWRTVFYTVVALVYGAICYLFSRMFVLLILLTTRGALSVGMGGTSRPGVGDPGATKLDAIWPAPTFDRLDPSAPALGLGSDDTISAFFVGLWVMLLAATLLGFLISFYFSSSTVIYYLLRREVDATDIEDVYIDSDGEEDDFGSFGSPSPAAAGKADTSLPIAPTAPPPSKEQPGDDASNG